MKRLSFVFLIFLLFFQNFHAGFAAETLVNVPSGHMPIKSLGNLDTVVSLEGSENTDKEIVCEDTSHYHQNSRRGQGKGAKGPSPRDGQSALNDSYYDTFMKSYTSLFKEVLSQDKAKIWLEQSKALLSEIEKDMNC